MSKKLKLKDFSADTGLWDMSETELHGANLHSKYWADVMPDNSTDVMGLISYQRAVAKFVNILTSSVDGRNIPVIFSTKDASYTDGNVITLTSKLKNEEFDAGVGLALHEASHIMWTDTQQQLRLWQDTLTEKKIPLPTELENYKEIINNYRNWIEDRRIDYLQFKFSPGYQNYYRALYTKYFGQPIIGLTLQSDLYRIPTMESYQFRIYNMLNSNSDFTALPELDVIRDLIDIPNISRLKSNLDSLNLAIEVVKIIVRNIDSDTDSGTDSGAGSGDGSDNDSGDGSGAGSGTDSGTDSGADDSGTDSGADDSGDGGLIRLIEDSSDSDTDNGTGGDYTENPIVAANITKAQAAQLAKIIEAQIKFVAGDVEKKSPAKRTAALIKRFSDSDVEIVKLKASWFSGVNSVIIRNPTKHLYKWGMWRENLYKDEVDSGFRLGKILARKLQIRNDVKKFVNRRLNAGRIDKRMLASIGAGNVSIFEKTNVQKFDNAHIHLTIDASGSMSGSKWKNTIKMAVAIAYAASKVENVDVKISFRSSISINNGTSPLVIIGYDSMIDGIDKIKKIFPSIKPNGMTPEGVCFEAIMDEIKKDAKNKDAYFINFSDGYPTMISKIKKDPVVITAEAVNKIKQHGIKVLSFYISDYLYTNAVSSKFAAMYGAKNSRNIGTDDVVALAKELNQMFATL